VAEHALHELNGSACGQWEMLWCVTSHAKRVPRYRPKRRADYPRRHTPARRILRSAALLTGLGPLTWHGTYLRFAGCRLGLECRAVGFPKASPGRGIGRNQKVFFLYFPVTVLAGLAADCGAHY